MSDAAGVVETHFERCHGVHQYVTNDGMPITGISEPTWEKFAATLDDLPTTDGYIISPELITSPVPLAEIAAVRTDIEERAAWVQEVSNRHPWARLLLGTATFEDQESRPYNSVVAYMGGREIGRQHKVAGAMGEGVYMRVGFDLADMKALSLPQHHMMLCADIIQAAGHGAAIAGDTDVLPAVIQRYYNLIPAAARTVIVSSCWGVPPKETTETTVLETKCFKVLTNCVETVLDTYPGVEEVIVIDRAIPEFGLEPFNARFQRAATT